MTRIPQSQNTEKAILALALNHNEQTAHIMESLAPQDFHAERNNLIFRALKKLHEAEKPASLVTLTDYLKLNGLLEKCGGTNYL